jgi:hypothetical protein
LSKPSKRQQCQLKQAKRLSISPISGSRKSTKEHDGRLCAEENDIDQRKRESATGHFPKSSIFRIIRENMPQIERNTALMRILHMKHAKLVQEVTKATVYDMKLDEVS